ncbi:MAG: hypothetical protein IJ899_20725, partial [Blautia sp.]|nr:hypothetical protein [Blautia sp.]
MLGIIDKDENGQNVHENDEAEDELVDDVFEAAEEESDLSSEEEFDEETPSSDKVADEEKLDRFIADVESVAFSDESLVKAVPVTMGMTAGALKQRYDLVCEYSGELTESQIETMNAKVYYPSDGWVLISLKAFNTPEMLTVTMKTGESFQIQVTDAQIQKEVISASGDKYVITVTYDNFAEIPDGAKLDVREILPEDEEYVRYLNGAAAEIAQPSGIPTESTPVIDYARFFDITIRESEADDAPIVEPQVPVTVKIELADAPEGKELKVVHFEKTRGSEIPVVMDAEVGEDIRFVTESFSTYGVLSSNPQDNNSYALIVEYNNKYYVIKQDGTLEETVYNSSTSTVSMETPLLWTYNDNWGKYISHRSDAIVYNDLMLAEGYLYDYINPKETSGVSHDKKLDSQGNQVDANYTGPYTTTDTKCSIQYSQYHISCNDNGTTKYIGIDASDPTALRIKGNCDYGSSAKIYFAKTNSGLSPEVDKHIVNHIDIGMVGTGILDLPLAYGPYYDKDGHQILEVTRENPVTLHLEQFVNITKDDIKRSQIEAYDKNGNAVPDAFIITGYTANQATENSNVQVRMEGAFKVAYEAGGQYSNYCSNSNDNTECKKWRLNNRVYYRVTTNKDVDFNAIYNGQQLYTQDGELVVKANVSLSAAFDYWDEDNECPPVRPNWEDDWGVAMNLPQWQRNQPGYNYRLWKSGGIPADYSGMDFVLGGKNDGGDILAIEIVKQVVNENGDPIHPVEKLSNSYKIYNYKPATAGATAMDVRDVSVGATLDEAITTQELSDQGYYSGYVEKRPAEVKVSPNGVGVFYDYDVEPGMWYIAEDPNSITQTIHSTIGTGSNASQLTWTYDHTYVETEYVWRDNQYSTGNRHVASGTSAVPEILGQYTSDSGKECNNGFLEFYVYNVYKANPIDIEVEKSWTGDTSAIPNDAKVDVTINANFQNNYSNCLINFRASPKRCSKTIEFESIALDFQSLYLGTMRAWF